MLFVSLILLGVAAGFLSGLLGIGGGMILVPALTRLLGISIHQAIGISLAVIVPTACVGVFRHHLAGHVDWRMALFVVVSSVIGAWLGASAAAALPAATLKKTFALFLIVVGLDMYFGWTASLSKPSATNAAETTSPEA